MEKNEAVTDFDLPVELDMLLDGIVVDTEVKIKDYKTLRDERYANHTEDFTL